MKKKDRPKKNYLGIIIASSLLMLLIGVGAIWYFLNQEGTGNLNKSYSSYSDCVANTKLPCKHYFVGDMGQEWRVSPYYTKAECDKNEKIVGFTCIIPPGDFKEPRWINSVDLERE